MASGYHSARSVSQRRRAREPYYPPRREPLRAPWNPEEDYESGRRRSIPGARDRYRRQSALGRFVNNWGWRAYAIPVLLVISALIVADVVRGSGGDEAEPEVAHTSTGGPDPNGPAVVELPDTGMLPMGGDYTEEGEQTFSVVPGTTDRIGRSEAELFRYTVEVEDGVDTTDFGGDDSVAQMIDATLANPRSWTADGEVAFERVDDSDDSDASAEGPTFRISLTSPMTIREACGYTIELESSCYNPTDERVYLNVARWVRGAQVFEGDIGSYRQYLINHEVGHAIGHPDHEPCPEDGALAPIMMQQTFGVQNSEIYALAGPDADAEVPDNDDTCRPNGWPFGDGLRGADPDNVLNGQGG